MSNFRDHRAIRHRIEKVDELRIFYREAGDSSKQTVVLLHGCPHSSHQFRAVLASLADEFHLIAPDYPGFGDSSFIRPDKFDYTFDHLAEIVEKFICQRGLKSFVLTVHDCGAPIGFRIATKNPEKVSGFVVINAIVSEEGFNLKVWQPIYKYWVDKTEELGQSIFARLFSKEGLKWQYTHGTKNPQNINLDSWLLDTIKISRKGQRQAQLDLLYDYKNNVPLYRKWQRYLREYQLPVLLFWGKNDGLFREEGAETYIKDTRNIDYNILDTGHFPLEEEGEFVIEKMRSFLKEEIH